MIIAQQKRKENIAEYLLYMWQIEDLIRANNLDIENIAQNIVAKFSLTEEQQKQMIEWYESLIDMMRREDVIKSGHLQLNKNVILQLIAVFIVFHGAVDDGIDLIHRHIFHLLRRVVLALFAGNDQIGISGVQGFPVFIDLPDIHPAGCCDAAIRQIFRHTV